MNAAAIASLSEEDAFLEGAGESPTTPDAETQRLQRLQDFTDSLLKKRKEAIDGRSRSGIETEWQEDDEYYDGIDDANRGETQWIKGATPNSTPFTTARKPEVRPQRSTIFLNITQTYVDMASASVADMLLPTDDRPFAVKPPPEPDIEAAINEPTMMQGPNGQQMSAGDIAKKMLEEAQASADKAEDQIWDWLIQSQWHAEVRSLIFAAAKIGTGVLKGPTPAKRRNKKIDRAQDGTVAITMVERLVPGSREIDVRNLFPDPACGDDIHDGSYIWERDDITARALRDLKGTLTQDDKPMYLDSQIDLVLEEGPDNKYKKTGAPTEASERDKEKFDIWYMHGSATAEDMAAAGCTVPPGATYPVIVTMVNDRPIKVALSQFETGEFPYDVLPWQRVAGRWAGKGEGRKIRTPQRILNGAVRAQMNNAGLSAGPIIAIDSDVLSPADGNWEIVPLKVFKKVAGAMTANMKEAIASIVIDSVEGPLTNIIKFALEMADKCASFPIQQQGQQGVTQETAQGRLLLQNNASVQKRAIAKAFDDNITEPHIGRYYEYLLLYGEDPAAKREFVVEALGSSALFERDAQNMAVAQMASWVKDPAFGMNPKRWAIEFVKSNKLDPGRFEYTLAELQEIQKRQAQQQPTDPTVQAAQITAQSREKVATIEAQSEQADITQRAQQEQRDGQAEAQDAEAQREHEREMKSMDYQMMLMEYANKRNIGLDQAKVELTKTALELRTQKELAAQDQATQRHVANKRAQQQPRVPRPGQRSAQPTKGTPQVAQPATEPPGRAPPGEGFEK